MIWRGLLARTFIKGTTNLQKDWQEEHGGEDSRAQPRLENSMEPNDTSCCVSADRGLAMNILCCV